MILIIICIYNLFHCSRRCISKISYMKSTLIDIKVVQYYTLYYVICLVLKQKWVCDPLPHPLLINYLAPDFDIENRDIT